MTKIDAQFFDSVIYSTYKAIHELTRQAAWNIVWRAGEILLESLQRELGFDTEKDVFVVLRNAASHLRDVGYVESIAVQKLDDDFIEYEMLNPAVKRAASRLLQEGAAPPHVSTALMFAILKKFGMKAKMVGGPRFLPDGRVVEKWRLVKE